MLEIASRNVTTIAGSSAGGSRDGPGLTATFSFPYGVKWYCNVSLALCGVLVADTNNNAMRFVSVESMPTATNALSVEATATFSNSLADSFSFSSTWTLSLSRPISATISKSVHVSIRLPFLDVVCFQLCIAHQNWKFIDYKRDNVLAVGDMHPHAFVKSECDKRHLNHSVAVKCNPRTYIVAISLKQSSRKVGFYHTTSIAISHDVLCVSSCRR